MEMERMAIIKLVNDKQLWLVKKLQSVTLFILILLIVSFRSQIIYADCVYQSPKVESYGALVKSFKVMSINVYGQQGVMPFNDGACQDRLREIGEHIRDVREPYDIVGLQEWHTDTAATCNGVVLKNKIDDLYPVSGVNLGEHTQDHYQWAHPKAYDQSDGGLGIISKTKFLWDPYTEDEFGSLFDETHTETENIHQFTPRFNNTVTLPFHWKIARTAHGFLFARIFLSRNPDIAVDTYVVHLTSTGSTGPTGVGRNKCDLECKQGMLDQLREGIHQRSADSGFPVLVMGDFNIGGPFDATDPSKPCAGNDGYRDIMRNLGNPKDLWLEGNSTLIKDEGYTHISGDNRTKTRIDFIFVPSDPYLVNAPYVITHQNPRKINHVQLSTSDHRAIITELDIRKKNDGELFTVKSKGVHGFHFENLDRHQFNLVSVYPLTVNGILNYEWDNVRDPGQSGFIRRLNVLNQSNIPVSFRLKVSPVSLDNIQHTVEKNETSSVQANGKHGFHFEMQDRHQFYLESIYPTTMNGRISYEWDNVRDPGNSRFIRRLTVINKTNFPVTFKLKVIKVTLGQTPIIDVAGLIKTQLLDETASVQANGKHGFHFERQDKHQFYLESVYPTTVNGRITYRWDNVRDPGNSGFIRRLTVFNKSSFPVSFKLKVLGVTLRNRPVIFSP